MNKFAIGWEDVFQVNVDDSFLQSLDFIDGQNGFCKIGGFASPPSFQNFGQSIVVNVVANDSKQKAIKQCCQCIVLWQPIAGTDSHQHRQFDSLATAAKNALIKCQQ